MTWRWTVRSKAATSLIPCCIFLSTSSSAGFIEQARRWTIRCITIITENIWKKLFRITSLNNWSSGRHYTNRTVDRHITQTTQIISVPSSTTVSKARKPTTDNRRLMRRSHLNWSLVVSHKGQCWVPSSSFSIRPMCHYSWDKTVFLYWLVRWRETWRWWQWRRRLN